jgi:ribonuclease R
VSNTERRSMAAERDTVDRYVASYLANRSGEEFDGRVTGVTRFGLFVTLAEIGGDGLIPISTLGDERFEFNDKAVTLTGQWSGTSYRLGQTLKVRLVEAAPISGGLRFELVEGDKPSRPPVRPQRSGRRGAGPRKW